MSVPRSSIIVAFQFTHPGKGATIALRRDLAEGFVSIHAPWEGCDQAAEEQRHQVGAFQFTHPGKGATITDFVLLQTLDVSIHAPWEGCDTKVLIIDLSWGVSIHAPWEGCD